MFVVGLGVDQEKAAALDCAGAGDVADALGGPASQPESNGFGDPIVALFPFTRRSKSISPPSEAPLLDENAFGAPNDMKSSLR